ncbi:MAG: hypothetical protein ACKV2U_01930 [Bryobacteraceae bacterium]
MKLFLTLLLMAAAANAGLPMICHPIEIGTAKSLPWTATNEWEGADRSYDRSRLTADTLALLTPGAALAVRMETMRRAAIYARENARLGEEILARLMGRVMDAEAAGKAEATAWFDAGYFAETQRQMARTQQKDISGMRRGKSWVQQAIRMGGKGMDAGLARMAD